MASHVHYPRIGHSSPDQSAVHEFDSHHPLHSAELRAAHPWFQVHRLAARSHFPMFEVPLEMAQVIDGCVRPA